MKGAAHFRVATRGTSREINRSIVLNLVRAHQPISRADLARMMSVRRGAISRIVNDLITDSVIFEGATGQTVRGRKPTFLYIDSRRRAVVAADIRASETFLMLADLRGNPTTEVIRMPTLRDPGELALAMAERIKRMLVENREVDACEGVGVVVPGMVEHSTMRVIHAPTLGWKDVDLRGPLAAATGLPVQIENSGRACALAQAWAVRESTGAMRDVVFVSVSDGDSGSDVVSVVLELLSPPPQAANANAHTAASSTRAGSHGLRSRTICISLSSKWVRPRAG